MFGISGRDPVLGEVYCVGNEATLMECSHNSFGDHKCTNRSITDIAISCYGSLPQEILLVTGPNSLITHDR